MVEADQIAQGGVVVFDVETTKKPHFNPWLPKARLCSVGMLTTTGRYRSWVFEHSTEKLRSHKTMIAEIKQEIAKADTIIAHNLKFDIKWLWKLGIDTDGKDLFCTMVADYLLNGQRRVGYTLNDCAQRYGLDTKLDEMKRWWDDGYDTPEIPLRTVHLPYLEQDVSLTAQVYGFQKVRIAQHKLNNIADVSMSLLNILGDMEYTGFPFDIEAARGFYEEHANQFQSLTSRLQELVGFPLLVTSIFQLSAALYGGKLRERQQKRRQVMLKSGKLVVRSRLEDIEVAYEGIGIKPIKNSGLSREGFYKTDKDTLKQLKLKNSVQKETISILQELSRVKKVMSTLMSSTDDTKGLVNLVQASGRVHPNFNQTVTATGRLSSSNPNAQNLPKGGVSPIKGCIISELGKIVNVDLAQIEFRVAAELSKDPVMLREIKEGLDTHADNAIRFFGAKRTDANFGKVRTTAKIFTFRLLYGGSAYAFFMDPSMPSYTLPEWERIVKAYYKKYKVLEKWQESNHATVLKQGYLVNPSGRILGFTKARTKDGSLAYSRNQVCNYPVQSAASDLMYIAMIEIIAQAKASKLKAIALLQVHDSLVFDCADSDVDSLCEIALNIFEDLPRYAQQYYGWELEVPLTGDCEVGPNYKDNTTYARCAECAGVWFHPRKDQETAPDTYVCDRCQAHKNGE